MGRLQKMLIVCAVGILLAPIGAPTGSWHIQLATLFSARLAMAAQTAPHPSGAGPRSPKLDKDAATAGRGQFSLFDCPRRAEPSQLPSSP